MKQPLQLTPCTLEGDTKVAVLVRRRSDCSRAREKKPVPALHFPRQGTDRRQLWKSCHLLSLASVGPTSTALTAAAAALWGSGISPAGDWTQGVALPLSLKVTCTGESRMGNPSAPQHPLRALLQGPMCPINARLPEEGSWPQGLVFLPPPCHVSFPASKFLPSWLMWSTFQKIPSLLSNTTML